MTLPSNCGPCDCNCIVADHEGRPYPVGMDRDGNQAIIVPDRRVGCGPVEFAHGSTACQIAAYPWVAIDDDSTITSAVGVLSGADTAAVIIGLRVNDVQVSTLTIPAGQEYAFWSSSAFPIVLQRGDRVETVVLSAGANLPSVGVQVTMCLPGPEVGGAAGGETVECVSYTPRGTLAVGQNPTGIGIAATAPALCFYQGSGGNHDSLYLVAKQSSSGALGHRRIWPPDPVESPLGVVAWSSATLGATPATPDDPTRVALAVDTATTTITHRWDPPQQLWIAFPNVVPQRVEFQQAGAHRPPNGPVALTFFPQGGTLRVDMAGVWTQHTGGALTLEVIDHTGTVRGSFAIPAGQRTVEPTATIVVAAGDGIGIRVASSPSTPGDGVSVTTTFTRAA